jgi:hypothetical protein
MRGTDKEPSLAEIYSSDQETMPKFLELYLLLPIMVKMKRTGSQTYLLRGMCSKGPDAGIVPHKSLLETSLKQQSR